MAPFRKIVVAVLVFVLFVGGGFATMQVADFGSDSAARNPDTVTNESINQQTDLYQFVNKALEDSTTGFNESVEVRNSSDAVLDKGEDYFWNASDGTIRFNDTVNVTDGATGSLNYTYFRETKDVQALSQVIDPLVAFAGRAPLMAGGLALAVLLLAFGAIVAKYFAGSDVPRSNR